MSSISSPMDEMGRRGSEALHDILTGIDREPVLLEPTLRARADVVATGQGATRRRAVEPPVDAPAPVAAQGPGPVAHEGAAVGAEQGPMGRHVRPRRGRRARGCAGCPTARC
ncbi:hypothetical protein [Pseudonocardia sp. N23]|uniref:hypothetical protein n=1 Tax=Pseudonocardia sp. N23 TaxID=1987376 RepID=UPI0035B64243